MRETLANIAVIAATLATLSFLVPQIVKLVRTGDAAGVSTTWPAIGFISNLGWTIYFVHERLWASVTAPVGAFVGYGVTLWALARIGRPLQASAARGTVFAVVLVAITAAFGWTTLG
ncbi:MAG: PQ-loop repeat-containing protein, partial [Acidimicrobiia bacterium]|nr:PQ-loop repeat-containing protein [Acidimicrobiia bacterium]